MTIFYFYLGVIGVGSGCLMVATGLGLHWQGLAAVLVGAGALALGVRDLRAAEPDPPRPNSPDAARPAPPRLASPRAVDPIRPGYTAAHFTNQYIVPPAGPVSIHRLPNQVDADADGIGLMVGYGDYISPVLVTDDPWRLPRGRQLVLALEASPGADAAAPRRVGHENCSGLLEDDFERFEYRLPLTAANVLALRATRFEWTPAAEDLAAALAPPAEAVEAVRQRTAELARRDYEAHTRASELMSRLSRLDRSSPEAAAAGRGSR